MDNNPFDLTNGEFTFIYPGSIVLLDGRSLKRPQIVLRLLSLAEFIILESITGKSKFSDMETEESIFEKIYIRIYGISNIEIDFDKTEAGFLPSVTKSAIIKTKEFLEYPESKFQEYSQHTTVISTMMALISRLMSISFIEVEKMPMSTIFRYYAILSSAFPNECGPIIPKEEEARSSSIPGLE
jgi:hypothetical protein